MIHKNGTKSGILRLTLLGTCLFQDHLFHIEFATSLPHVPPQKRNCGRGSTRLYGPFCQRRDHPSDHYRTICIALHLIWISPWLLTAEKAVFYPTVGEGELKATWLSWMLPPSSAHPSRLWSQNQKPQFM